MQVKENWSHVVGRVERWTPPPGPEAHGELVVRVDRVTPVAAHPNLLADAAGTSLRVRVPAGVAAGLDFVMHGRIEIDVRRVKEPGVVYANPETIRMRKPS